MKENNPEKILYYSDFDKFRSLCKTSKNELAENDESLPYCLRLMYILNKRRRRRGSLNSKENEKNICDIADFLDNKFKTKFYFRFDYSHRCSYGREYCDMQCGPSEYTNCNMNAPVEYLYQTYEDVDMAIDEVCKERSIVLANYIYKAAVQKACDKIKIQEDIQQNVQNQFSDILNGESYKISINYKSRPDPFINVLQQMLLDSNYGYINSYMLFGEKYNPDDNLAVQKEYIRNELEIIRRQMESGMYFEIKNFWVNTQYQVKSIIMELLSSITLSNGQKLADKINNFEYSLFDDSLIQVFIPLNRGYTDWNTCQAVQRINQYFRPNDIDNKLVIDGDFLKKLFDVYN